MNKKLVITEKINLILKRKNLTAYKLSKLAGVSDSALYQMIGGNIPFSTDYKEKILPYLEVSKEELESWIIADKYPKKIIKKAIETINNKEFKDQTALSQNINRILKEKNLSQRTLGKIIGHSQSTLSCVITGKESLSKNLMKKISTGLDISEEDLQIWNMADKYSLKVLELALNVD